MFLYCLLCGIATTNQLALCSGCKSDLPWINSPCQGCGLPLPDGAEELHCGECQVTRTPFTQAITPLFYQQPINHMINTFKHHRSLVHGRLLAELLAQEILDQYTGNDDEDAGLPEVIIPVPLHWRRFLWRGYNQSVELGNWLSKTLGIPCRPQLLRRIRQTPSQQGLSRQQRLLNLKNAFQIKQRFPYTRVALLDDVVTTGSTTMEIATLLRKYGVTEVHLWAVARTPL